MSSALGHFADVEQIRSEWRQRARSRPTLGLNERPEPRSSFESGRSAFHHLLPFGSSIIVTSWTISGLQASPTPSIGAALA
jgi:hypothetical protein